MAGPQGSSFIPKQPANGSVKRSGVRRIYIFTYVAFVMFFGTIIASAGTFFYQVSVESQLEAEKEKLVQAKEAFSQADIEKIKAVSLQIEAAKMLLDNHISAASIFDTLEKNTVSTIQLTDFSLVREDFTDIMMSVSARTNGFNPARFQREIVRQNPILAGSSLVGVGGQSSIDEEDPLSLLEPEEIEVTFTLEKELKPNEVMYQPYTPSTPVIRNVSTSQAENNETTASGEAANGSTNADQPVSGNQVTQ